MTMKLEQINLQMSWGKPPSQPLLCVLQVGEARALRWTYTGYNTGIKALC